MAVSAKWFGKFLMQALGGTTEGETAYPIDYLTDTMKVALLGNVDPAQDTTIVWDTIDANEIANGNGYTTGGVTLGTKTIAYTAGTNVIKIDAADAVWAAATITAYYAVIYKDSGTPSTSPVMGYVDFGGAATSTNGEFRIAWHDDGMLTITAS